MIAPTPTTAEGRPVDGVAPGEPIRRRRRIRRSTLTRSATTVVGLLALLAIWEIGVLALNVNQFLLPRPSVVAAEIVERGPLLWRHTWVTLIEVIIGFVASVLIGIPLGVFIASSRVVENVIHPVLVVAQTIPKVALAPLFVVWLGFGLEAKILVAFLIAFFPVVISTVVGIRSCPPEMIHLVRSMGANPWQRFSAIRFPAALPSIFGGLKVAVTLAVVGALVGEFVGASVGLGYLIGVARGNLDTPLLFASIAVISAMGVILFSLVDLAERRLLRWHISVRTEAIKGTL